MNKRFSKVGRPTKMAFPAEDPAIKALMELMYLRLFHPFGLETPMEMAIEMENLFPKHGVERLKVSQLNTYLFLPFSRNESVRLSKKSCSLIYTLLQRVKKTWKPEEAVSSIEILENFRKRYSDKASVISEDFSGYLLPSFKHNGSLQFFYGTNWFIYERMGDYPLKGANWGVTISRLAMVESNGFLGVRMDSRYEGEERIHKGIASADGQYDYLFIDLIMMDRAQKRANFVLRLAELDSENQSLMIGHYTYHSRRYKHLLSKTVVLHKINGETAQFEPGDYTYEDICYSDIPDEVKEFLYPREKNRMSLPGHIISNLSELQRFCDSYRGRQINKVLLKHFCHKYFIYYKHSDKDVTEDKLSIYLNKEAVIIEAEYTHNPDRQGKYIRTWVGKPYANVPKRVVSIKLSYVEDSILHEDDPILITFWLPDETLPFSECECFPGVISGLEDSTKGPIAMACLLIKEDLKDFSRTSDERLKAFFIQENNLEITPRGQKFKLSDFE